MVSLCFFKLVNSCCELSGLLMEGFLEFVTGFFVVLQMSC